MCMATNQYVQNYTAVNEQDLVNDLVIESIQMKGLDVKYLEKTQDNINYIYNEDPSVTFDTASVIEMYPVDVDGFGGDGELMSTFGLEIKQSATFVVSKDRFTTETTLSRPLEGDLIYMPITNAVLEISYVNSDSPFFEQGKQYVWEVKTHLYEPSYETSQTGDTALDNLINSSMTDDPENEESYGNNTDVETEADPNIQFDPNNPFGA